MNVSGRRNWYSKDEQGDNTMQVMNNSSSLMALGELKKNESTLGKQLKKVSSGLKINGAGDGASEYAISKRMTVQVRSLGQDQQNVQNGKALMNVASADSMPRRTACKRCIRLRCRRQMILSRMSIVRQFKKKSIS